MRFDIFTLFPEFFAGPLESSILKRARAAGVLRVETHDIRDWAEGKHRVCDDYPYGGGAGMVMKAEPVVVAIEDVINCKAENDVPCPVILMSPQGRVFSQSVAQELSRHERIALLCGHYEGIDERAIEAVVTDQISIGDYILSGGETAALVVLDAVARLVPGVLGNAASAAHDTFSDGLLEAPQYTRPALWRGRAVPEVLLGGHHGEIEKWRFRQSVQRTKQRRPDLWDAAHQRADWPDDKKKLIEEDDRV